MGFSRDSFRLAVRHDPVSHAGVGSARRPTWIVAAVASTAPGRPRRIVAFPQNGRIPLAVLPPRAVVTPAQADLYILPLKHRTIVAARLPMLELCEVALPEWIFAGAPGPRTQTRHPLAAHLMVRLYGLRHQDDPAKRQLTESVAESLRLHIVDCLTERIPQTSPEGGLSRAERNRLLRYIDCAESDTSVGALAALLGISVPVFTAVFVDTFQLSPHQFILDRRITRAKQMLAEPRYTITEIALTVGFSTHSHFCTTFKQRVGTTPSEYRICVQGSW